MEKIRKPRVLLTGFTPFGGETVNPALEAVKRVRCPEAEVRVLEVPTVFGESSRVVTAAMDAFRPDVVLCVGQAAGRSAVTPERVAINEAVELAKGYDEPETVRFINGILGSFVRGEISAE